MKKTLLLVLAVAVTIALLVPGHATAAGNDKADCPEGKLPVTIVMPGGHSRSACIPPSAVKALERAQDNSPMTLVTGACPKECWTSDTIAKLTKEGTLTCAYDEISFVCALEVDKEYSRVLLLDIDEKTPVCYSETSYDGFKISATEYEACIALLKPFHIPSLDTCRTTSCIAHGVVSLVDLIK